MQVPPHDPVRALADDQEFVRTLFEASSIGMNLCRLDGLWLRSNPAFLQIIGYSREEADEGLTYWQLTPRKYDASEAEQLRLLGDTGRYGPYEKEFVRKDGTLVPVRLNGYIVETGGQRLIWSFIEDITIERELAKERLAAIHQSKLAALGELAASIVHEINNPLAVIAGYSDLALVACTEGNQELVHEAVEQIQRAVTRAGAITDTLRRMYRDSTLSEAQAVSVAAVVRDAATLTGPKVKSEGLTLDLQVDTEAAVRGNPIELGQVLINLVNNAVDAVKDAPERRIGVTAHEKSGAVEICVEDSGPGVPEDQRHRLFDPFFTTKPPELGTGLGLSISQQIARSMGGNLAYERAGDRTRFVLRLPAVPPHPGR
jgi:PAS domain S-box-containing protein